MNVYESDILKALNKIGYMNQSQIADYTGHSLGMINKSIKSLIEKQYLTNDLSFTECTSLLLRKNQPERAIILAAGFGMRMVPINMETPKAFIQVYGERLIERQIKQLHEVGVQEIYVVVGFLKERFEYLIDEYGVRLIINTEYSNKGNLFSLKLASAYLDNAYIIPSDIWTDRNPFDQYELYSWYMVSDLIDDESEIRVNRKCELVKVPAKSVGNTMIGISYLTAEDACIVRENINKLCQLEEYNDAFWETALYEHDRMIVMAKIVKSTEVIEINTYEQLRDLDSDSKQLESYAISVIGKVLDANNSDIEEIAVLKKGMTNRSFLFSCKNQKYIMRIPGEGTDQLINRKEEAEVYKIIADKKLCDDVIYINPENGYKITSYIRNARVCDIENKSDLNKCMDFLHKFHDLKLKVNHEFDLYQKIEFYEKLWEGKKSVYQDYRNTKENVYALKRYVEDHIQDKVLTHIDAVPDNFLFSVDDSGSEILHLIDWEYAAMQDPHVDIAMFCIYALFEKEQVDELIDMYFKNKCDIETRIKIYCYISICGLLWSNWCEYKSNLGVEFGEYNIKQYRYAKEYYRYAVSGIKQNHLGAYIDE